MSKIDKAVKETANKIMTMDAFQNTLARMGFATPNVTEGAKYPLTRLTRNYNLMTANIDIIVKEQKDAAVIPWDSFSEDEQGNTYVLVGDNMQQSKHIITTGILDGDNVEVTSGLSKGDTILVRKRRYNISMTKEETKGFLSMGPGKRKTGKDILNNGQNKKA